VANLFQNRGATAVFDDVVQKGGNGLILVASRFQH
jgi:hypothetical protein